ncbi:facilitated trehalose transporter Tret1-like isoform X2 [Coccinella septempunctata]|uniref:facilitated trehalose transporter Tret1-like isoform X2 n=1 Tax=Coccinella septempunctata TaxID=41139 RepID=UPI001D060188|nr:facilitated trehalose transporter Tret1-like isoform X2 [Coccinella septempunctata]
MAEEIGFKSSRKVYFIVFSSYLYSLTNEIAISWTSPVLPQLRSIYPNFNPFGRRITIEEEEWLGSLICLGYMAGLLPYGYLCSKYGRKYTLLSLGVIHIIAFMLFTTESVIGFYVGRFLSGVASSVGFIIFPMYISEICKDGDRGALLVSRQIFAGCGTVIAYVAGNYLSIFWFNYVICIFPLCFLISFLFLAVESPYFYVTNQRLDNAREVYIELTSQPEPDEEIEEMQRALEIVDAESIAELITQKHILKSILIVFALFIFQQLTGYMAFATYTEIIVKSKHATIFIGVVVLLGSSFTTFFIDRFGRKMHLYASVVGVIFVNLALAIYYVQPEPGYWTPVVCITLFFLMYNLGLAFIPQIICAEILPQRIKFGVATIAGVFGWGVAFLITRYFLELDHVYMVLAFAICSLVQLVIIFKYVPETNGQSFRVIQGLLQIDD